MTHSLRRDDTTSDGVFLNQGAIRQRIALGLIGNLVAPSKTHESSCQNIRFYRSGFSVCAGVGSLIFRSAKIRQQKKSSQENMTPFFDTSLNYTEAMELMMCPIREESFPVIPINKRKRVRILSEPQVFALILPQSEMSDEERQQRWWQKNEYESSKMAAKNKCREIRKKGTYKGTLTEAYDQAHAAPLELLTMDATMTEESVRCNPYWMNISGPR
jgi:hypothetical protein